MTTVAWPAIRTNAIDKFNGQIPRAEDEDAIIPIFEYMPRAVIAAIDEIAIALNAGRITWAWSVLRKRLEQGSQALSETTVDLSTGRETKIRNARAWITNAGQHCDRWADVEDELSNDVTGRLRDHRDEPGLADQMRAHWEQARPQGKLIEQQAAERALKWKTDRKHLANLKTQTLTDADKRQNDLRTERKDTLAAHLEDRHRGDTPTALEHEHGKEPTPA